MRALFLLFLAGMVAFGADDPWAKVRDLKTGEDLQVYKKGSTKPIAAQMGQLSDDALIVIVKKTETAIPKDQIDRIDARPAGGNKPTKETTTKDTVGPDGQPTSSTSTGYSWGSKPGFETVYHRPVGAPKQ